jgi:hypothetical protein
VALRLPAAQRLGMLSETSHGGRVYPKSATEFRPRALTMGQPPM